MDQNQIAVFFLSAKSIKNLNMEDLTKIKSNLSAKVNSAFQRNNKSGLAHCG